MNKDEGYNGEERRLQGREVIDILVTMQKQTHACVKELGRDVKRNTAFTVANGVKLDTVMKNGKAAEKRLKDVELWRAGHIGESTGEEHKESRFTSRTTLICVIGTILLTLLGLWFTIIQPALSINAEVLADFRALNGVISELNILKE